MRKSHLIKVYTEAARMVAEGDRHFSCMAISRVLHDRWDALKVSRLYLDTIQFDEDEMYREPTCLEDRRMIRVLLLLLMAEWVRTDYEDKQ